MATKQQIAKNTFNVMVKDLTKNLKYRSVSSNNLICPASVINTCKESLTVKPLSWQAEAKQNGLKAFITTIEVLQEHRLLWPVKEVEKSLKRIEEIGDYILNADQIYGVIAVQYKIERTNYYMTPYHAKHDRAKDPMIGHPDNFYPLTDTLKVSKRGTYHISTIDYEKMIRTNW